MGLDTDIDSYLSGRGSPMAGLGSAFVNAGRKYGVDPRMLVGIAVIESGAGQHMKNANSPFNWSVHSGRSYGSFNAAIDDVARGLRHGYLDEGLTTPQQIVQRYAPSSDGNNEARWANVVSSVMTQLGGKGGKLAPIGPSPTPLPTTVAGVAQQARQQALSYDPLKLSTGVRDLFLSGGGHVDLAAQLPGQIAKSWTLTPPPSVQPNAAPAVPGVPATGNGPVAPLRGSGGAISLPLVYKATHPTDGLQDQGFTRAIDIMGSPGTPVLSPGVGTVLYFHPNGAQGGGSMMVRFQNGREGWIGHIAQGLPAGTKIAPGTQLAVISGDHPRPHVHWDLR